MLNSTDNEKKVDKQQPIVTNWDDGLDFDKINIEIKKNYNEKGLKILEERYARHDKTPAHAMWRICKCVAGNGENGKETALLYMSNLLVSNRFLPNTPTWTGAGIGKGQLAACFVLPIEDNMESIFGTLRDAALIQSTGGGTGFTFGHLRPAGSIVKSSQGTSSGPVSFIESYDAVFNTVKQGGTRRGANMAMMPASHPDIFEFIKCKQHEGKITNFNLSVSVPDKFMCAVKNNYNWPLINPTTSMVERWVSARTVFDQIAEGGKLNGEPGVVFIDAINRDNPVPKKLNIEATNPCVTGNCVVNTSLGPTYVRNLIGKEFKTPFGSDVPNGFFETKKTKTLVKVISNLGYSITCTPEHKLQTSDGWKEASELTPSMRLTVVAGTYSVSKPENTYRLKNYFFMDQFIPVIVGGESIQDIDRSQKPKHDEGCTILTFKLVMDIINCSTLKEAVHLIREIWDAAGCPEDCLTFGYPGNLEIVRAIQLVLLRLCIVCNLTIAETNDQNHILRPLDVCLKLFRAIVGADKHGTAVHIAENSIEMMTFFDDVRSVTSITSDNPDGETVYDAQCLSVDNDHRLSTNAFISHNCSEVPLSSYESCCLGSINLRSHTSDNGDIDWGMLDSTIHLGVQFLDDVIDANNFVPSIPRLAKTARKTRRIGLGIMGLADVLFRMNIRYGSAEAVSVASQIIEFVRYHSMLASRNLATVRGSFKYFNKSTYANNGWKIPTLLDTTVIFGVPICPVDINMPRMNWMALCKSIRRIGMRNITTTAIAPTGTLSLVAGVSGFGCEPVFALVHRRRIIGTDGSIRYAEMAVPELIQALNTCPELQEFPEKRAKIIREISQKGTCIGVPDIPEHISRVFVCASDLTVTEHVMMQAALQRYVDGAISKTINLPPGSGIDDVKHALTLAWNAGCKGICVYVANSRNLQVLTAGIESKESKTLPNK